MKLLDHVYLIGSGAMGFDWTDPSDCNIYLLDGGDKLAVIDTGTGTSGPKLIDNIKHLGFNPLAVTHILLTHFHADHVGGSSFLKGVIGAKVAGNKDGKEVLEKADEAAIDLVKARSLGLYPASYSLKPCKMDISLSDNDLLRIGNLKIRVLILPGHSYLDTYYLVETTAGHVSLFSGDGVFFDGKISMLNTHDFNIQDLSHAIECLSKEKVDSLFPGHNQPALNNGSRHVMKAKQTFDRLAIPQSIV